MAVTNYIINYTDPLKGNFVIKPYTSNGPKFPITSVRPTSSVTTNSPLLLYGKGHPNYGERTDENLLHLAENFSGASAPIIDSSENTIRGILWHTEILYQKFGATYYQWDGSTWNSIVLSGASSNGNIRETGSPVRLQRYSSDEREINDWITVEFEIVTSDPTGSPIVPPTRVLKVNHDGTSTGWVEILSTTVADSTYLRLDTTNDPLTGPLTINSGGSPTSTAIIANGNIVINSQIRGSYQSAGAPTYSFTGDSDIGMYRVSADSLGFSTGGTLRLQIESNGTLNIGSTLNYHLLVTSDNDIPNKRFVDLAVAGAVAGDTFVNGGSFNSGILTLTFTGSPAPSDVLISGFTADDITFTGSPPTPGIFKIGSTSVLNVEEALDELDTQKASLSGATFLGSVLFTTTTTGVTPVSGSHLATKNYVDAAVSSDTPNLRKIALGSDGPAAYTLPFDSIAGYNKVLIFKNGVKQYKDLIGFDEAQFSSTLTSGTSVVGLPSYSIIAFTLGYPPGSPVPGSPLPGSPYAGSPIPAFWTISGDHVSNFTSGDTIRVDSNTGLGIPISYVLINSPVLNNDGDTDLPVTPVGSPGGTETGDGLLGITYEFQASFDDGSPFTTYYINGNDITLFSDLITSMNTQLAGAGSSYLYGSNIRVETLGGTTGSVVLSNGIHSSTSDLFDATNLGIDGFTGFRNNGIPVPGTVLGYNEGNEIGSPLNAGSPLGSPLGFSVATPGTTFDTIIFNSPLSPTDIVEFLLI